MLSMLPKLLNRLYTCRTSISRSYTKLSAVVFDFEASFIRIGLTAALPAEVLNEVFSSRQGLQVDVDSRIKFMLLRIYFSI